MLQETRRRGARATMLAGGAALLLTACADQPLDFDLRGLGGGFSTADAATGPLAARPQPDARGVISYPTYQVAVAQRGDTLIDVAGRIGADPAELARYNGIEPDIELRKGEIIALPMRVAEGAAPVPAAGGGVDITTLAGAAINRAPATPGVQTSTLPPAQAAAPVAPAEEPVRHRVARGETAYTISRLYGVPVQALAEWNGLGPDFAIREGQFLLIPVQRQAPPQRRAQPPAETAISMPGTGSRTPTPPSAVKPLPQDEPPKEAPRPPVTAAASGTAAAAGTASAAVTTPVVDVGRTTAPVKAARMETPVQGTIIRGYTKGKNEGINIQAAPGAPVKAAEAGTVAAITKSADGVPIVVVRHPDNLLTVYANVTQVSVAKGDSVRRGQQIASLRGGSDAYVHFEVRKGFDSVDPTPYLE